MTTILACARAWLPEGGTLPLPVWQERHRWIVRSSYVATLVCVLFGLLRGYPFLHAVALASFVAVPAVVAGRVLIGRTATSALASLALLNACSVCIAIAGGRTEAHFTFFVVIGILTVYQDWVPFLIAIGYVVLHHGLIGTLAPTIVFDHASARDNPWIWAAIHGALILAASLTYVIAWRLNESYKAAADTSSARLAISEERFRALVQRSSDVTLVCDRAGVLSYVSPASLPVLGVDSDVMTGFAVAAMVHPDDQDILADHIRTVAAGNTDKVVCRIVAGGGTFRWVEMTFADLCAEPAVAGVVLHVRDISDRHALESELRHAQKLESVGQLAAGLAYEIITPIQFVGNNVGFLRDAVADQTRLLKAYQESGLTSEMPAGLARISAEVDPDFLAEEIPQAIDQTLEGIERVETIVKAMKAFGQRGGEAKASADLNQAVRDTLVVASHALKGAANVHTDLADLPPVTCHIGDINQVLLNLIVNAAQAITATTPDATLGRILVRTWQECDEVVLEVSDTGGGIPAAIGDKVFEPFFTTRAVGAGSGQGLATAHALICDRHSGSITFESEPGVGTTFTVRLPVHPVFIDS